MAAPPVCSCRIAATRCQVSGAMPVFMRRAGVAALFAVLLAACSPEVGSKEWCDAMKQKPKGDWTANEAADFAKHCIF